MLKKSSQCKYALVFGLPWRQIGIVFNTETCKNFQCCRWLDEPFSCLLVMVRIFRTGYHREDMLNVILPRIYWALEFELMTALVQLQRNASCPICCDDQWLFHAAVGHSTAYLMLVAIILLFGLLANTIVGPVRSEWWWLLLISDSAANTASPKAGTGKRSLGDAG